MPLAALEPLLTAASRPLSVVAVGGVDVGDWRELRPCVVDCDPESETYLQAAWIGSKQLVLEALRKGLLRDAGRKGKLALYSITAEGRALQRDLHEDVSYWRRTAQEAQEALRDVREAIDAKCDGELAEEEVLFRSSPVQTAVFDRLRKSVGVPVESRTLREYVATITNEPIGRNTIASAVQRLRWIGWRIAYKGGEGYTLESLARGERTSRRKEHGK